jgi:chromate reductase, NAD(P)H dehydrogenase (quinone)
MPITLLALSGSLRRDSLNTALLRTAVARAPEDVAITVHPLDDLPMYDGDLEVDGRYPQPVEDLRAALRDSDGLLLAFPEYNWSIPAVIKNAIDWASRGPGSPMDHKPTAMMSAAGSSGGSRAQSHMADVLGHNQAVIVEPALQVPRAGQHIADGRLVSPQYVERLDEVVQALARASTPDRQTAA